MQRLICDFSWDLSTFDTKILGFKTAKIVLSDEDNVRKIETIGSLVQDLKNNGVVYATLRIKANDFLTAQELEKNGFIVVDGIITLEKNLEEVITDSFLNIRSAKTSDLSQLISIGATVFIGRSRYYHDSMISENKANDIYSKWVENSVKKIVADDVLIWEHNKKILGLISLQKKGQIPLVGVIREAKGRGIGKELLSAACAVFRKWDLKKVTIETQITNIPALRLYQSSGFKIVDSYLTFRWHVNC
ncbi:GNAT family N-acetyltransferase [Candidatus Roizmanbacteria bacterium]|nr:GNAT family N-acetyltransferase [Candidatus Roizmanbacteria bacterium]